MIQKRFDNIGKADIDLLISDQVPESKTLEYKQKLPGGSDRDRKEFLADVSSFANASGGDIIYGIEEAVAEADDGRGKNTAKPKCVQPIEGTTADEAKRRLEEMIRRGIDPRLGVQIKEITGWGDDGQGFVILIHIRKSFASPHMVTLGGTSRFHSRHSSGKYQLDVDELRTAFLATESQAERIKHFRQDRIGKIIAEETPIALASSSCLVLHVIPLASFLNNERLDLSRDPYQLMRTFGPLRSGRSFRHNLDGFLSIIDFDSPLVHGRPDAIGGINCPPFSCYVHNRPGLGLPAHPGASCSHGDRH